MIEIINFKHNPILRKMLVNYIIRIYEEDAIIDDEHLLKEYNLLKNNNEIHFLFNEEWLINFEKDGENRG